MSNWAAAPACNIEGPITISRKCSAAIEAIWKRWYRYPAIETATNAKAAKETSSFAAGPDGRTAGNDCLRTAWGDDGSDEEFMAVFSGLFQKRNQHKLT
jgi:hypothetical protein